MQVSIVSDEREKFSDRQDIFFGLLTCLSSIVTSRKRKLRELFAVATQSEGLPHPVLTNPDAPTTTPAEWQFLQANDIIQYVLRYYCAFFQIDLRACRPANVYTVLTWIQRQDAERSQYPSETNNLSRTFQKVSRKSCIHCARAHAETDARGCEQT